MTETDVLELAKEVLNYLDHGDTPYIKKISWLAYEAAPALAAAVIRQAEVITLWQDEAAHQKHRADTYSRRAMVLFRRLEKFRMGGAR